MEKFIWTQDYSVGIEVIDKQHQHFFDITNKVLALVESGWSLDQRKILEALTEMGNYAFYHFGTEEKYFESFHYDDASAHIAAHKIYRDRIGDLMTKAENGGDISKLAVEAASFSGGWLLDHILVMDRKYSKFFHEHGL